MPQTIAFVVLEKSGRSALTFDAAPLTFGVVLDVLLVAADSSLF